MSATSTSQAEKYLRNMSFPHIPTLVSPKWLFDALENKMSGLCIVDTSFDDGSTRQKFGQTHIAHAQFFSYNGCCDEQSPYTYMLPSAEQFQSAVRGIGIDKDSHVVLYDTSDLAMAAAQRTWWMFRVFGHQQLSILEGGLKKWRETGYEVTDKIDDVAKGTFEATYIGSLVKSFEDIVNNIKGKEFQLVDARSPGRYNGTVAEPKENILPGHIPGSTNLFFMELQDEAQKMKSPEDIRKLFQQANIDLDKPVTATCGTGITACHIALGAHLCGKNDVAIYDGSWMEYYLRAPPELKESVPEERP